MKTLNPAKDGTTALMIKSTVCGEYGVGEQIVLEQQVIGTHEDGEPVLAWDVAEHEFYLLKLPDGRLQQLGMRMGLDGKGWYTLPVLTTGFDTLDDATKAVGKLVEPRRVA